MVRGKMLNYDERHPRISGQKCQELLQSLKPARRRADADDAAGWKLLPDFIIVFHMHPPKTI